MLVALLNLKWLPPHSADPLPEFQFRNCDFVVSDTGFSNFRLWSVGISIFPALELRISRFPASERRDFNISGFGALRIWGHCWTGIDDAFFHPEPMGPLTGTDGWILSTRVD